MIDEVPPLVCLSVLCDRPPQAEPELEAESIMCSARRTTAHLAFSASPRLALSGPRSLTSARHHAHGFTSPDVVPASWQRGDALQSPPLWLTVHSRRAHCAPQQAGSVSAHVRRSDSTLDRDYSSCHHSAD